MGESKDRRVRFRGKLAADYTFFDQWLVPLMLENMVDPTPGSDL